MKNIKINDISEILETELPDIIKKIAEEYKIPPYIDNPDFLEERLCSWHQFGLLTHTKKVRRVFLNELNGLLKEWRLQDKVESYFSKDIDGVERKTLFEISIPLHDLGKIVCYSDERVDREHEKASKTLISTGFLKEELSNFGLSDGHRAYLEQCIETHDVLGKKLRDVLKHKGNLRLDYVSSRNINNLCKDLARDYFSIKTEIGIFFLCDLLGKTDLRVSAENDMEIMQQETNIQEILEERGLSQKLKQAVMQLPVNLKLSEIYLKSFF